MTQAARGYGHFKHDVESPRPVVPNGDILDATIERKAEIHLWCDFGSDGCWKVAHLPSARAHYHDRVAIIRVAWFAPEVNGIT